MSDEEKERFAFDVLAANIMINNLEVMMQKWNHKGALAIKDKIWSARSQIEAEIKELEQQGIIR